MLKIFENRNLIFKAVKAKTKKLLRQMTLRKIRPLLNPLIPLIRDVKKLHILFLYNVTTPLF